MNDLDTRIRRLLGGLPAVPGSGQIRFGMNCSRHLRPFVVAAAQEGDTLTLLHNEDSAQAGADAHGPLSAPAALGSFRIEPGDWPGCLWCGALKTPDVNLFWICGGCGGFNCCGSDWRGQYRCQCGEVVCAPFEPQQYFTVHGARSVAASAAPRSAPLAAATSLPRPSPLPPLRAAPPPYQPVADASLLRLPRKR